jgi:hypothetical protein
MKNTMRPVRGFGGCAWLMWILLEDIMATRNDRWRR